MGDLVQFLTAAVRGSRGQHEGRRSLEPSGSGAGEVVALPWEGLRAEEGSQLLAELHERI